MESGIKKHRKHPSAGGGRAWTEEEEAYLINTRKHKMPYKHIAAHLNKTELACRLHYHQMSYGSNWRRRTASVSSSGSSGSVGSPVEAKPQGIPESTESSSLSSSQIQSHSLIPILPKPDSSEVHSHTLPAGMDAVPDPNTSPAQNTRLQDQVDTMKLRGLYDAYRDSFWSLIASEYSKGDACPTYKLEQAFFESILQYQPSSRDGSLSGQVQKSPNEGGKFNGGFHAINRPAPSHNSGAAGSTHGKLERCTVASLLTVEKDVWAPKEVSAL